MKFTDVSTEEISSRKMIILIPFALLRVRDLMEKERSPEKHDVV